MLKIREISYKSAVVSEGIIVNHQMPIFKVYFDILISDPAQRRTMTNVNWNLIACTISGKNSKRKEFLEKLEKFWPLDGENPQRKLTNISLGNTLFTAIFKDGMCWIKM